MVVEINGEQRELSLLDVETKNTYRTQSLVILFQVQNRSGEWIYAKPIPGTFVCNIGDMLKVNS